MIDWEWTHYLFNIHRCSDKYSYTLGNCRHSTESYLLTNGWTVFVVEHISIICFALFRLQLIFFCALKVMNCEWTENSSSCRRMKKWILTFSSSPVIIEMSLNLTFNNFSSTYWFRKSTKLLWMEKFTYLWLFLKCSSIRDGVWWMDESVIL